MKAKILIVTILVLPILMLAQGKTNYHAWWNEGYWDAEEMLTPEKMPLVSVEGARFVIDGEPILFRGLSISDPDKIEKQGHWNKAHFEQVKAMGANLVRIPVHPIAWKERTPFGYLEMLKQAVDWCTELEMYVIIDWHSIGNLKTELFQAPMYDTSMKGTYEFWQTIAKQFAGNNTVAFYEIFNEPTRYNGQLGKISWDEWKTINEDIIDVIRSFDPETVALVAGFNWAYDLTVLHSNPLDAENVGYVTHPYAIKRPQPWEKHWNEDFGFAAEKYPIIATEIGFGFKHLHGGSDEPTIEYGERIVKFLEGKNISWMAWVFDPQWEPNMIKHWNYDLTECGDSFKKAMLKNN